RRESVELARGHFLDLETERARERRERLLRALELARDEARGSAVREQPRQRLRACAPRVRERRILRVVGRLLGVTQEDDGAQGSGGGGAGRRRSLLRATADERKDERARDEEELGDVVHAHDRMPRGGRVQWSGTKPSVRSSVGKPSHAQRVTSGSATLQRGSP